MSTRTDAAAAWLEPGTDHRRGDWSWQLRGDEVADIGYRGRHLLRSVRAVSRDADWGTRALRASAVRETTTGVQVDVTVDDEDGSALLVGTVTVEAVHARLTVTARLEAQAEVRTNRTGLVVLHPTHLAGTALAVTHPGGDVEATQFPRSVSPHQPAVEIAGLSWTDGGLDVAVGLEGDVFEMEDQRNWTDASFKTYSRPLALPFPYRVAAGEVVHQQVQLSVRTTGTTTTGATTGATGSGAGRHRSGHQSETVRLTAAETFPEIAVGAATAPDPAPAPAAVGSAVLVELELGDPRWRAALARARDAGLPLDVRVVLDARDARHLAALDALVVALVGTDVVRIAAFDVGRHVTDVVTGAVLRASLEAAGLEAPVVGGARSHFTQLNREQEDLASGLLGTTFSTTPLFHAVGTEQLVESVAVQRTVAEQAVAIAGGGPVHVGPVTLRPRFNDVATTPPSPPDAPTDDGTAAPPEGLPEGYGAQQQGHDDPRQSAPQLAAWTIASAAALAVPGVASLTYFEEWGPRGIRTADGDDLPVAAALRALADLAGGERLVGPSPDGLVWAVGATRGRTTTVLAANLDTRPRRLVVETPWGSLITGLGAGAWSASTLG
ncbi:hypothetical protein [Quadrisphaera setariae]|uniref:Uncharacterized protein n=1 Tax=Quadrisphaera setariae TaxID=2593304 RepID=A0A5C8ZD89_9ACTN|nr:hypothetical protein [Quadrisphaera setariae]TXR55777.1 hypothetical protein FMM08_13225 [Quadrisphaera setariae]